MELGLENVPHCHSGNIWLRSVSAYYAIDIYAEENCRTFGTSVYSAGIPQIAAQLDVSHQVAILGLSLYSFGLGT
jgi:hypothetical protein